MSKKTVMAVYEDDYQVVVGAKKLTESGFKIKDVFSPFPIHGIDPVIGLPRTRIATVSFLLGSTGTMLVLLGVWYMMIHDWHIDIGGKPNFALYKNLPAFIPVTFEFTVFCAAHGMFLTFLLRSKILPGVTAANPDPRTTDDQFIIVMEVEEDKIAGIKGLLQGTGCIDIRS